MLYVYVCVYIYIYLFFLVNVLTKTCPIFPCQTSYSMWAGNN